MALIITLIIVGILLLLIEMLVIPGIGFAGFLGLASLAGSCWYAFHQFGSTAGGMVTLIVVCMVAGMLYYALRGKTWKRLSLQETIDAKSTPDESRIAVGDRGRTLTRLSPSGMAKIGELSCEVKSQDSMIDPDTEIEVILIEDNKIFVIPVSND
ncbi:MAG: serine protease [Bacteroidales bacterium]|jgi:membrane-bound ClpP family serine protease|nr:NfeD family protein [Bacteroidota bacterium]NLN99345.1 serine protease [Bacteroidales bacterium]